MSQSATRTCGYSFEGFYLDVANRQLSRAGQIVPLNSKYMDVLLLLVSRSGQLVEKQEIFDRVWQGLFVTDAALTQCIKDVRRQLGDDAGSPRFIKTVPKHGYMFVASVTESSDLSDSSSIGSAFQVSSDAAQSVILPARPYKFLDYYTEQDAALFFGREAEVEAICSHILAHRTVILHGRSGVGKSSILRAGLTPRLRSQGHHVFVVRSFTDPLHYMIDALAKVVAHHQSTGLEAAMIPREDYEIAQTDPGHALNQMVLRFSQSIPGGLVVFLLDQFEEFFTLLEEETREAFIAALAHVASIEDTRIRLVFTLREDLLAEMSRLKRAIPEIFHHEDRLTRFSCEQAALAITEPARLVGCRYEPTLVDRLLDDLSDNSSIDPPQLQIVCDSLYDSRNIDGALTVETYERLGTAKQILAGYLERVLNRFRPSDLHAVRAILTSLISPDRQRLVLRSLDLYARVRVPEEASAVEDLMEELVRARIVRGRRQDGETWFELAHDFLTAEVSRWLTADELALKRAHAVIERAMENYRIHALVIDADALELVLPFGRELRLTAEEADVLAKSALSRRRTLPAWLVQTAPSITLLITEAAETSEAEVRLCAVEACRSLQGDFAPRVLRRLALWDSDLSVRKAASIALAERFPGEVEAVLSIGSEADAAGRIRRAISLAIIRDEERGKVRFTRLPLSVSVLVVAGLIWVRLRRGAREIARLGIGGTLGGACSGTIGGLLLGVMLANARGGTFLDSASLVLVLVSLGASIGGVGAFGVSFGMVAASEVAYRHSRWWAIVGAVVGPAIVGGSSKFLGVDTVRALFGASPTGITGSLEGAMIGAGFSLGALMMSKVFRHRRAWQSVLGASLGAMCAGVVLTLIGGNLFSGSLEIVAHSFANSQIRLDPLAIFFGELHFGQNTQVILGAIEGFMFGAGTMTGIEIASKKNHASTN